MCVSYVCVFVREFLRKIGNSDYNAKFFFISLGVTMGKMTFGANRENGLEFKGKDG